MSGMRRASLVAALLLLVASGCRSAPDIHRPLADALIGDVPVAHVPFEILRGYAFVEGSVAGQRGVFILDTGTPDGVFLNHAAVDLPPGERVSIGRSGSAQGSAGRRQEVFRHSSVGGIIIAGRELPVQDVVRSSDFSYVTDMANGGLRPDILGFIGLPLLAEHEITLDYQQRRMSLHRLDRDGRPWVGHVDPEDVVVVMPFRRGDGPQRHLPFTDVDIAGIRFEALLDNGTLGDLALTPEAADMLQAAGTLRPEPCGQSIQGLRVQGLAITAGTPVVRDSTANSMRLGYNLLRHYRSVWNYRLGTVTLLRPLGPSAPPAC
jgi:hypothetical protein